jgi:peroxiredoxin
MVNCDRCHRNFSSYEGLEQHYRNRHSRAQMPAELRRHLAEEKSLGPRQSNFIHKSSRARVGVFVLMIIVAAVVIGAVASRSPESGAKTIVAGSVAPDFTLHTTAGGAFTLSDYKGKSNVLLFFNEGLACSPCLQQMQGLDQLNSQFASMNLVVASITTDGMGNLASWASTSGPKDSVVLSDQSLTVSRAYDMMTSSMHPGMVDGHSFVIVNPQGIVVWRKDYYPDYNSMYVPNDQLLSDIKKAMGV